MQVMNVIAALERPDWDGEVGSASHGNITDGDRVAHTRNS